MKPTVCTIFQVPKEQATLFSSQHSGEVQEVSHLWRTEDLFPVREVLNQLIQSVHSSTKAETKSNRRNESSKKNKKECGKYNK